MSKSQPVAVPEQFKLRESDKASDAWPRLRRHFEERLAYWRAQNDGEHDAVKTARIRGRIDVYKDLLALDPKEKDSPPGL